MKKMNLYILLVILFSFLGSEVLLFLKNDHSLCLNVDINCEGDCSENEEKDEMNEYKLNLFFNYSLTLSQKELNKNNFHWLPYVSHIFFETNYPPPKLA